MRTLSLALITEPFRVCNRELAEQFWTWRFVSAEGGSVASFSGIEIETLPLTRTEPDIVLLMSSYHPETALEKPLLSWLKSRARSGAIMGCVDTGALVFAEAGLLRTAPAAVHFEALRGYREKYPGEMFVDCLFDVSANRCSSAGGVATFDMTLGLIERFNGKGLADRVAEILTYSPSSHRGPQQKLLVDTSLKRVDNRLAKAVDLRSRPQNQDLPRCQNSGTGRRAPHGTGAGTTDAARPCLGVFSWRSVATGPSCTPMLSPM